MRRTYAGVPAEGVAHVDDGRHDPLVVHAHGTDHGEFAGNAARHLHRHADERQFAHGRMGRTQADLNSEFTVRVLEKLVEQVQQLLLLLEGPEQLAHLLAREVQVQADQVGGAVHVHFRRQAEFQQAALAKQLQLAQDGIVGGRFLLQPVLDLLLHVSERTSR